MALIVMYWCSLFSETEPNHTFMLASEK